MTVIQFLNFFNEEVMNVDKFVNQLRDVSVIQCTLRSLNCKFGKHYMYKFSSCSLSMFFVLFCFVRMKQTKTIKRDLLSMLIWQELHLSLSMFPCIF